MQALGVSLCTRTESHEIAHSTNALQNKEAVNGVILAYSGFRPPRLHNRL